MAVVYQHRRNDDDSIFYIGIGTKVSRSYSTKDRNKYWHHIVNKYGYSVELLFTNISWEEACEWEIKLIKQYGRKDLKEGRLVNLTDGGDGTFGYVHTEEARKRMSDSRNGEGHFMYGKSHPEETRKKISNSLTGEKHPQFGKTGKECHNYGRHHTEETKKKLRESNKGEKNAMFGMSGEKAPSSKRVAKYDKDSILVKIYGSTREAERDTGVNHTTISRSCRGLKIKGSDLWRYE